MSFGRVSANVRTFRGILSSFDIDSYKITIYAGRYIKIKAKYDVRRYLQSIIPHEYLVNVTFEDGFRVKCWEIPYKLFDRNLNLPKKKE